MESIELYKLIEEQMIDMLEDEAGCCPRCESQLEVKRDKYLNYIYECDNCGYWKYVGPEIEFDPPDPNEFKRRLIKNKKAIRYFINGDGEIEDASIWRIRSFSESSDLYRNIVSSKYYQDAISSRKIKKIRFVIV